MSDTPLADALYDADRDRCHEDARYFDSEELRALERNARRAVEGERDSLWRRMLHLKALYDGLETGDTTAADFDEAFDWPHSGEPWHHEFERRDDLGDNAGLVPNDDLGDVHAK